MPACSPCFLTNHSDRYHHIGFRRVRMGRARLRDLGRTLGRLPTGPRNAMTDVPGVLVGHRTLVADAPRVTRTGVTMVIPRNGAIWTNYAFAGAFSFNGNGEMTGIPWIDESGMLGSPIGITNTYAVGLVRDALIAHAIAHGYSHRFHLPVVAETFDGYLNDIDAFPITRQQLRRAPRSATPGTPGDRGARARRGPRVQHQRRSVPRVRDRQRASGSAHGSLRAADGPARAHRSILRGGCRGHRGVDPQRARRGGDDDGLPRDRRGAAPGGLAQAVASGVRNVPDNARAGRSGVGP